MAGIHGKGTKVLMDGWDMSRWLNSIETPVTVDTAETTVFNSSGTKTYITGNADATIIAEGFWAASSSDAAGVEADLVSALSSSALNVWTYWPEGTSTGRAGSGVTSIETGYTVTSPVDGTIDISIEGQVSNGRDRLLSHTELSAKSTTGNAVGSIDNSVASTNGGIGYLQRTDSSTRHASIFIADSANNSTFDPFISFTTGTTGRIGERIAASGTVKQYTVASWVLSTGSTAAVTFQVGFSRKE